MNTQLRILKVALAAALFLNCKSGSTSGPDAQPGDGAGQSETRAEPDSGPFEDYVSQLPAPAKRVFDELAKLASGQPGDLDGDGKAEAQLQTSAGGAMKMEVDWNGDGKPDFIAETVPGKSGTMTIDSNLDGTIDVKVSGQAGPPPTRTIERDTDFDGKLDWRARETWDAAANTVRIVTERDPEGDGSFTQLSDETVSNSQFAGGSTCDGQAGFPKDTGSPGLRLSNIRIPYDGSSGRCTKPRAERLAQAVSCAMSKARDCLNATNREYADKLAYQLLHGTLVIGCGNSCQGKDAATQHMPAYVPFTPHMNVNPTELDAMSNDDLCGVMTHELLHWAGEGFSSNHDQGTDRIYSCGRYCGGCTKRGPPGSFKSSNVDCAVCSVTDAQKKRCGTKEASVNIPCPSQYTVCHGGLGTNLACSSCKGWQLQACDDTSLQYGTPPFDCCATCPSNATKNDMPCSGAGSRNDQCAGGIKPPFCP